MVKDYIRIHKNDTVAVALKNLPEGRTLRPDFPEVILQEDICQGHKIALENIQKGEAIRKYGYSIGVASQDIKAGCWVHSHNLRTNLESANTWPDFNGGFEDADIGKPNEEEFYGYERADGRIGIRNEIWILPTVGCVNETACKIAQLSRNHKPAYIDGIYAFSHPYGCSQLGDDQENTRKILALLATHPNTGGVLILGLGCENSNIHEIRRYMEEQNPENVHFLEAQNCEDEVAAGVEIIDRICADLQKVKRKKVPMSKLIVGVKCGGSDGLSGITANPLVGRITDHVVRMGGTVLMSEVPEVFGAEHILLGRSLDKGVYGELKSMVQDFRQYFSSHGLPVYENPSPGNKKGGITTLEEKSLGCVQKSGNVGVSGVLKYAAAVKKPGFYMVYGPGNDLVSSTALAAAGAQMILFTTGRGTPFAAPVPTLKIASNHSLALKKSRWIDFDAGMLTEEGVSYESQERALLKLMKETAEGKYSRTEEMGFHDMAIFKQGVTL